MRNKRVVTKRGSFFKSVARSSVLKTINYVREQEKGLTPPRHEGIAHIAIAARVESPLPQAYVPRKESVDGSGRGTRLISPGRDSKVLCRSDAEAAAVYISSRVCTAVVARGALPSAQFLTLAIRA